MTEQPNHRDSQGQHHGVWKRYWYYYGDGTLERRYPYLHGKLHGLSENYCSRGTLFNKKYYLTIKWQFQLINTTHKANHTGSEKATINQSHSHGSEGNLITLESNDRTDQSKRLGRQTPWTRGRPPLKRHTHVEETLPTREATWGLGMVLLRRYTRTERSLPTRKTSWTKGTLLRRRHPRLETPLSAREATGSLWELLLRRNTL